MVVGEEYPIIILTAYDWSDVEQEAREAGVTAFVSKPLFLSELREVLMSQAQRELLKNDVGDGEEKSRKSTSGKELIQSGEKIRIVFSENSAFEPVIANLILNFNEPVNILKADTKNVRGVAKGEMILEFAPDCTKNKEMKQYLLDRGLDLEEVNENVD